MKRLLPISLVFCCMALSCDDGSMTNNGRVKPHEPVQFFADGNSSRALPEGTVSRDASFPGAIPNDFPFAITRKDLARGQERYNIYCSVCHGYVGDGDGMVVRRGFTRPPSFHTDHFRQHPPGHIVQVITNGFGAMYSYSDRVNLDDRWRIAAYIRALQLSQRADPKQLPPQDQQEIQKLQ
jgi:mono/diheme cytochrome c family protein